MKPTAEEIEHARGTLAAKSLGGPVAQKYVKEALRTLFKAGLIPRVGRGERLADPSLRRSTTGSSAPSRIHRAGMSADEAFNASCK